MQLFSGDAPTPETMLARGTAGPSSLHSPSYSPGDDRVLRLENEVAELRREVAEMREQLATFRKQFE
jgi:uncharacterized protein YceH (UPF0502 family)